MTLTPVLAAFSRNLMLLIGCASVASAASAGPPQGAASRPNRPTDSPMHVCDGQTGTAAQPIHLLEVRSIGRIEEDLSLVDGINADRDVLVVACRDVIWSKFAASARNQDVLIQVRAWRKPADGGWLEMRLNEPPQEEAVRNLQDARRFGLQEVNLLLDGATGPDPSLVIPLRRELVKPTDLVRIRIRIGPRSTLYPPPPPSATQGSGTANPPQNASTNPPPPIDPVAAAGGVIVGDEEVLDSIFEVGKFGLHVRFSDMALFVQRLGEDRANNDATNPVLFDSVNFRPAPGVNYGFNYYHRRHASIRMLEPGFGVHIVFLNWNDRPRGATSTDIQVTQTTNLQIGIGLTGSIFDGTVVGALGWNLQVKDQRPYIGLGFSITGLARKISQFVGD